jgi:Xaa-Pro aminopeptidase
MNSKEFQKRRRQLMRMVGQGGIVILPSAPVRTRSRDVEYRFRQDSDFYYMTGFEEPEAVAVLVPGRPNGEYLLFCREKDPKREQWDGLRAGQAGAIEQYGADDAFPIEDLDDILPGIMESCSRVYYTMGQYAEFDTRIAEWVNTLRSRLSRGVHTPQEFVALDHLLHDMRLFKSRGEISAMRKSAKVAVEAHKRAMKKDGDLLLIDAGCELDYYASDITRTFPVNGRFSPEQRAVYEIVLEAQKAAIEKTVVGNHWNDPHDAAVRVITKGLRKLGLLEGSLPRLIKDAAYQPFYMHRTGHWIGMDVHDVGDYKVGDEWRTLETGMVTTVEPGIYIGNSRKIPKKFRNIGIRIEDDVAITSKGPDVLTKGLVSDPDDIESLMNSA